MRGHVFGCFHFWMKFVDEMCHWGQARIIHGHSALKRASYGAAFVSS
jgi:hypothetical protein